MKRKDTDNKRLHWQGREISNLHSEDTEDDEESTADEDNVADRSQR